MVRKYARVFILVLCMSYSYIYTMEEAPTCIHIIKGWLQCCCDTLFKDELIEARDVWAIKEVQYYCNQPKVTVHYRSGHILELPNGPTDYQADLLKRVPDNFNKVVNKDCEHPYYCIVKSTSSNGLCCSYFRKRK